ncbi:LPP protein, partial [Nothocercus julius]|nr:LPP protein [Nothocercus julius]
MSHPSWLPPKSTNDPVGHVPARMETTHAFGTPSISVSTQQTPKKFAPVVAPKPKYNPYKQPGGDGDFLPPPPPPVDDLRNMPAPPGAFPPPPPLDEVSFNVQVNPGGKTLEERRSSLDAEIDSLTSILADLESSSPYKPRTQQVSSALHQQRAGKGPVSAAGGSTCGRVGPAPSPRGSTSRPACAVLGAFLPVGMQSSWCSGMAPCLLASRHAGPLSSGAREEGVWAALRAAAWVPRVMRWCSPLPAASASAKPGPGLAQGGPLFGTLYFPRSQDTLLQRSGSLSLNGSEPPYVPQSAWKPEPAYPAGNAMGQPPPALYQPPGPKKTYITDPVLAPQPPALHKSGYPSSGPTSSTPAFRPEDELEHLTKKMLYDMENPPSDDYFGRCARCGENVVGEGTGCTAMDQVFHVECFTCMICNNKLRGQPFYAVEKKAYCEACYINTLEQCSVCAKPIMERILRATGKAYHPHCFTCVMCHRSLDGIPFTVDAGGNIHCIEDFHKKFAPRCSVCKEPIMPAPGQEETVRIVALDRDFHVQCYRCEDCGGLLSEGDNQGCYPLDGHILCKTCNSARIQALTAKASTDL